MKPTSVSTPGTEPRQSAQRLESRLMDLLAAAVERAFESGQIFNEIAHEKHFEALGFQTFEAYVAKLEASGFKRSTIFSNMKLAATFDPAQHGAIGIGKLRLLLADYLTDPHRLIAEGFPSLDDEGKQQFRPLSQISCRELSKLIRQMRPLEEHKPTKKAPSGAVQGELARKTVAAAAALLLPSPIKPAADVSEPLTTEEALTADALCDTAAPFLAATSPSSNGLKGRHTISGHLGTNLQAAPKGANATSTSRLAIEQRSVG